MKKVISFVIFFGLLMLTGCSGVQYNEQNMGNYSILTRSGVVMSGGIYYRNNCNGRVDVGELENPLASSIGLLHEREIISKIMTLHFSNLMYLNPGSKAGLSEVGSIEYAIKDKFLNHRDFRTQSKYSKRFKVNTKIKSNIQATEGMGRPIEHIKSYDIPGLVTYYNFSVKDNFIIRKAIQCDFNKYDKGLEEKLYSILGNVNYIKFRINKKD